MNLDIYNGSSDKIVVFEGDNLLESEVITLIKEDKVIDLTDLTCDMGYVDINTNNGDIIENLKISSPTEGKIELPINSSLTKKDGIYDCELRLKSSKDDYVKFTAFFSLIVKANVFNRIGNGILKNDSFSKIQFILDNADKHKKLLEDTLSKLNETVKSANDSNITLNTTLNQTKKLNTEATSNNTSLKENIIKAEDLNKKLEDNSSQFLVDEEKRKKNEAERIESEKIREEKIEEFGSQVTKNANNIADNTKDIERAFETINDNSFLPFEGQGVSIEHSKVGFTKDMVISGGTYQNLFTYDTKKVTDNSIIIDANKSRGIVLDVNKKYTIKNNTDKQIKLSLSNVNSVWKQDVIVEANSFSVFKPIEEGLVINNLLGSKKSGWTDNDIDLLKSQSIILEGDWTHKDIPPYFEGIKSVAETEGNKIIDLSIGKNLLPFTKIVTGTWKYNQTTATSENYCRSAELVNVEHFRNKELYIFVNNRNVNGNILQWDKDNKIISEGYSSPLKILNNTVKIGFNCPISVFPENSKIMTIFTNQKPTYESYKQDKKEILLPFVDGLKGFLNGLKDTIEIREDGLYIIKRLDKRILTDLSGWIFRGINEFGIANFGVEHFKKSNMIMCDKLKVQNTFASETKDEGIFANETTTFIRKSSTQFDNLEKFINWIKTNPVTVYYELTEPIEYKIADLNSINLETFKDMTYISSENEISPSFSFKAPVDIPKTISSLRNANTMLIAKNVGLENKNTELEKVNTQQNKALKELNDTTSFLIEDSLSK